MASPSIADSLATTGPFGGLPVVAKNMKNPTAKTYEGPKNYPKLVLNVPKLYSLSDKQLQKNNPFEKTFIMTHTESKIPASQKNLRSADAGLSPINTSLLKNNNNQEIVRSYLTKPLTSRGKLESRQINEVAGRSLNIWRSSKKRLSDSNLTSKESAPVGVASKASAKPIKATQQAGVSIHNVITDY